MKTWFSLFFLLMSFSGFPKNSFDHTHKHFNHVLQEFSTESGFKYQELIKAKASINILFAYLKKNEAVSSKEFSSWNQNQKLAFLINFYNANILKAVLDNYPIKSISELGKGVFGQAANDPYPYININFLGKKFNLQEFKQNSIRRPFEEPRIHFALNGGAKGFPPLRNEAYIPEKLDQQLNDQMGKFMSLKENAIFPVEERSKKLKSVYVSKIIDWHRAEFNKTYGNLKNFVLPYVTETTDEFNTLRKERMKVKFLDFDWKLNSK